MDNTETVDKGFDFSTHANSFVEWVKESVNKSQDFLEGEIPLIIQEYLTWIFYENLLSVVIWVFLAIAFGFIQKYILKKAKKNIESNDHRAVEFWDDNHFEICVGQIALHVVYIAMSISFFCSTVSSAKTCIKVKVAPRVVLIEKASELLGGKN